MSNIDYIYPLKTATFNKEKVIDKFEDFINSVLKLFKQDCLNRLIPLLRQCIPKSDGLIDTVIKAKCSSMKVPNYLNIDTNSQLAILSANFTLNEQFYILAHIDLELISPSIENPCIEFINLFYSIIRHSLLT